MSNRKFYWFITLWTCGQFLSAR